MRMDKMMEMLLTLGLVAGAAYLVVKYVIPSLKSDGGSNPANNVEPNDSQSFMDKLADFFNNLMEDDSPEGVKKMVDAAAQAGLSPGGTGALLVSSSPPKTAQSLYTSLFLLPTATVTTVKSATGEVRLIQNSGSIPGNSSGGSKQLYQIASAR